MNIFILKKDIEKSVKMEALIKLPKGLECVLLKYHYYDIYDNWIKLGRPNISVYNIYENETLRIGTVINMEYCDDGISLLHRMNETGQSISQGEIHFSWIRNGDCIVFGIIHREFPKNRYILKMSAEGVIMKHYTGNYFKHLPIYKDDKVVGKIMALSKKETDIEIVFILHEKPEIDIHIFTDEK